MAKWSAYTRGKKGGILAPSSKYNMLQVQHITSTVCAAALEYRRASGRLNSIAMGRLRTSGTLMGQRGREHLVVNGVSVLVLESGHQESFTDPATASPGWKARALPPSSVHERAHRHSTD